MPALLLWLPSLRLASPPAWWDASTGLTRLLPFECLHSPGQGSASPGACTPKQLLPARVFPAQDPKALAISAFLGARLTNPEDLWGRSPPPEPRTGPSRWPLGLALAWASQEAVA